MYGDLLIPVHPNKFEFILFITTREKTFFKNICEFIFLYNIILIYKEIYLLLLWDVTEIFLWAWTFVGNKISQVDLQKGKKLHVSLSRDGLKKYNMQKLRVVINNISLGKWKSSFVLHRRLSFPHEKKSQRKYLRVVAFAMKSKLQTSYLGHLSPNFFL